MYEEFFRLQRKPFRTNPKGAEVFVGPQTARLLKSMKTALLGSDAVVAVMGPAGIGKSALVNRALDSLSKNFRAIRMPRARLGHDEVLDFLLSELEVTQVPRSTIRKVLLCRELLAQLARSGRGLCIVVEDAERIGEDAMVELEALTAADGHDDQGARIVLQGSEALRDMLKTPALNRLAQRTRLRFKVEPLGAGELLAYVKHGFRLAGAEYEQIFADDVAPSLHELSGGVPRLVNNLIDTVLAAAAEQRRLRVDAGYFAQVAKEQFGLECAVPAAARKPEPPAPLRAPAAQVPVLGKAERHTVADTLPDLEQLAPELASPFTNDEESAEIPTLFSSTRMEAPTPATSVLPPARADDAPEPAPVAATGPVPDPKAEPAAAAKASIHKSAPPEMPVPPVKAAPPVPPVKAAPPTASVPPGVSPAVPAPPRQPPSAVTPPIVMPAAAPPPATKKPHAGAAPPSPPAAREDRAVPADDVPAWDKDPTLAELRPDLEALELAMAEFSRDEPVRPVATDADDPVIELKDATFAGVPEITLDIAIQQKIAEATDALKKHDQTIAEDKVATVPAPGKAAPEKNSKKSATLVTGAADDRSADLKKVAEGIARAKSLEDVDDKMAETLFGEEFSAMAAAVAANAPSLHEPGPDAHAEDDDASVQATMEREFREVYGADAVEVSLQGDLPRGGLDLSASQRLATVRALNAERQLSESARIRAAAAKAGAAAANRVVPSQSIEEQITTSMTQTLRALNVRPANDDDDSDDDERKGGFFSRFRRH